MTSKIILVTGATGYIASRLIPRLLECGYRVRALARHPERLIARKWFSQVEDHPTEILDHRILVLILFQFNHFSNTDNLWFIGARVIPGFRTKNRLPFFGQPVNLMLQPFLR